MFRVQYFPVSISVIVNHTPTWCSKWKEKCSGKTKVLIPNYPPSRIPPEVTPELQEAKSQEYILMLATFFLYNSEILALFALAPPL